MARIFATGKHSELLLGIYLLHWIEIWLNVYKGSKVPVWQKMCNFIGGGGGGGKSDLLKLKLCLFLCCNNMKDSLSIVYNIIPTDIHSTWCTIECSCRGYIFITNSGLFVYFDLNLSFNPNRVCIYKKSRDIRYYNLD